jgi:hypothetical protein
LESKNVVLNGRILHYNLSSAALQSADKAHKKYVFTFQNRWTTISPVGGLSAKSHTNSCNSMSFIFVRFGQKEIQLITTRGI